MSSIFDLIGDISSPKILDILEAELYQMSSPDGLKMQLTHTRGTLAIDSYKKLVEQFFIERWTVDIDELEDWFGPVEVRRSLLNFRRSISVSKFMKNDEFWNIYLDGEVVCSFNYNFHQARFNEKIFKELDHKRLSDYIFELKVEISKEEIDSLINKMNSVLSKDIIANYFRMSLISSPMTKYSHDKYIQDSKKAVDKDQPVFIKTCGLQNFEQVFILYRDIIFDEISDEKMKEKALNMYNVLKVEKAYKDRMDSISKIMKYNQLPD